MDEWLDRLPRGARLQIVGAMKEDRPSADSHRTIKITLPLEETKIVYTNTDEAPMLATRSFLPIAEAFSKSSGVRYELKDISLAARILSQFPERLSEEQR